MRSDSAGELHFAAFLASRYRHKGADDNGVCRAPLTNVTISGALREAKANEANWDLISAFGTPISLIGQKPAKC